MAEKVRHLELRIEVTLPAWRAGLIVLAALAPLLLSCGDGSDPMAPGAVASITISPASLVLNPGDSEYLTAAVLDARGRSLAGRAVTWSSSDTTVVIVSAVGIVTARALGGPVAIVATSEGRTAYAEVTVVPAAAAAVIVAPQFPTIAVGQSLQLQALVIDARGNILTGRPVQWTNSRPDLLTLSETGLVYVHANGDGWIPPIITAIANDVSGSAAVTTVDVPAGPVEILLSDLPGIIERAVAYNQGLLWLNPHLPAAIQAKIDMLQQPGLEADIRESGLHEGGTAVLIDGRVLPIGALFPADTMRAGAIETIHVIETTMPSLEQFLGIPFPTSSIRVEYGFRLGGAGGGGRLLVEDRGTYLTRPPGTQLEYDAMIAHEVAHSLYGNEAIAQFFEVYLHNQRLGSNDDVSTWTFTRNWSPGSGSNRGVHALMDIYVMIGAERMAGAFRAIYPLRPPYGVPLSAAAQQAFVRNAPAELRALVASKAALIGG